MPPPNTRDTIHVRGPGYHTGPTKPEQQAVSDERARREREASDPETVRITHIVERVIDSRIGPMVERMEAASDLLIAQAQGIAKEAQVISSRPGPMPPIPRRDATTTTGQHAVALATSALAAAATATTTAQAATKASEAASVDYEREAAKSKAEAIAHAAGLVGDLREHGKRWGALVGLGLMLGSGVAAYLGNRVGGKENAKDVAAEVLKEAPKPVATVEKFFVGAPPGYVVVTPAVPEPVPSIVPSTVPSTQGKRP